MAIAEIYRKLSPYEHMEDLFTLDVVSTLVVSFSESLHEIIKAFEGFYFVVGIPKNGIQNDYCGDFQKSGVFSLFYTFY